ncbi:MAG: glutamate-5-semialdehyde dehydrogenase, partial [Pseudomonadota bacterium]
MATVIEATFEEHDLERQMQMLGRAARAAGHVLATAPTAAKNRALNAAAASIRERRAIIVDANLRDMTAARSRDLSKAMLDRLELNPARIEAMAAGLEAIAALDDPIGDEITRWQRPNGLDIAKVRVPIGVIGIIYESRPNVTADAGGLCLKSGNAVVLRGGSESFHSSAAIQDCLRAGLEAAALPIAAIQTLPTADRAAVGMMLRLSEFIDVIVPRGGRSLIERVQTESRIPVLAHLNGNCHVYVHRAADPLMARDIALNAKMRRTGICGAAETLLVDVDADPGILPSALQALIEAGCEIRGDETG